ncbi:YbjP/YqhG family protein [Aurantimonas sp. MSK8Z-1]|nr:YbjP/YqhG family protein [Aurantimonas sp. MSK8Z-1]MCW4113826.1 YbjP/YqhG family protein [Aurantimonas sp. MSK8Z-1]
MRQIFAALFLAAWMPALAWADDPVEAVRAFYKPPFEAELDASRYTDPALAVIQTAHDGNTEGEGSCLDFSIAIDGQDYDDEEITRTLRLAEEPAGSGEARVTASFSNFDTQQEVVWTLRQVSGDWKVADVEGNGWRLSELCQ